MLGLTCCRPSAQCGLGPWRALGACGPGRCCCGLRSTSRASSRRCSGTTPADTAGAGCRLAMPQARDWLSRIEHWWGRGLVAGGNATGCRRAMTGTCPAVEMPGARRMARPVFHRLSAQRGATQPHRTRASSPTASARWSRVAEDRGEPPRPGQGNGAGHFLSLLKIWPLARTFHQSVGRVVCEADRCWLGRLGGLRIGAFSGVPPPGWAAASGSLMQPLRDPEVTQ
jgi:hypothetical protein